MDTLSASAVSHNVRSLPEFAALPSVQIYTDDRNHFLSIGGEFKFLFHASWQRRPPVQTAHSGKMLTGGIRSPHFQFYTAVYHHVRCRLF